MRPKRLEDTVRKTFTIPPRQITYIQEYVMRTGMSESEFIRRLIDQHMIDQRDLILVRENSKVKAYEQNTNSSGV